MRKILSILAVFFPCIAFSGQYIYAPGTTSTTGNTTLSHHLLSVTHNPAACHQVLRKGKKIRLAYWGSMGLYTEIGQVDNFEDEIDALIDLLDTDTVSLDTADQVSSRFNDVLVELGRSGYIKLATDLSIPGFPMAFRFDSLGGNVCAELNSNIQVKGSVLDDVLELDLAQLDWNTQSSLYLKSALQMRLGVSYSRPVWSGSFGRFQGQLIAGTRLNIYSLQLSKQVIPFESFDNGEDVSDVIQDEYDQNQEQSATAGVDVGLLWHADRYQLGFTVSNLIEPTFEYGTVGSNCATLTGTQRDNCFTAQNFVNMGRLNGSEEHAMNAVGTIDGAFAVRPNWLLGFSYDLADYNDAVGDELQWFTVATTFMPKTRWIPGVRVGYRKNLSGEELSDITFGTTLLGLINFDILYGLDDVEIDGDSLPRNWALNFGFEQKF